MGVFRSTLLSSSVFSDIRKRESRNPPLNVMEWSDAFPYPGGDVDIKDQAAVVGIGATDYWRRLSENIPISPSPSRARIPGSGICNGSVEMVKPNASVV